MKQVSLIALVAALSLGISGAQASDLYNGASTKDDGGYVEPSRVNWSGFYIGGRAGYGHGNHDLSVHDFFKDFCNETTPVDFDAAVSDGDRDDRQADIQNNGGTLDCSNAASNNDTVLVPGDSREVASLNGLNSSGFVGGGQVGYDQQIGRHWVAGVFGSYDFANMETTASLMGTDLTLIEKGDEWDVGVRFGKLLGDRTMLYILAAYTETDYTFFGLGTNGGNKEVNFSGVKVGGGLEHAIASNIFLGIEGTHTFYDDEELASFYSEPDNRGLSVEDKLGETKVMGTLKIKLNQDVFNGRF